MGDMATMAIYIASFQSLLIIHLPLSDTLKSAEQRIELFCDKIPFTLETNSEQIYRTDVT